MRTKTSESLCLSLPHPIILIGNATPRCQIPHVIDTFPTIIRFNSAVEHLPHPYLGSLTTHICCFYGYRPPSSLPHFTPYPNHPPYTSGILRFPNQVFSLHDYAHHYPRASTGLRLILLLNALSIPVTITNFDSFATPEFFNPHSPVPNPYHNHPEISIISALPNIAFLS